jgi:hypothetical protein
MLINALEKEGKITIFLNLMMKKLWISNFFRICLDLGFRYLPS